MLAAITPALTTETMLCSHQLPPTVHIAKVIERWAAEVEALSEGRGQRFESSRARHPMYYPHPDAGRFSAFAEYLYDISQIKTQQGTFMKSLMANLLIFSFFFFVDSGLVAFADDEQQKAVLITGASSGLGRATTELLASRGYFVYAGARKDKDLAELNEIENVQSVRLDVTVQEDIDAAVAFIRSEGRGLYGLVNNAGVVVLEPLIEIDEETFDFQMDVNVYGPYRITKAFAPLIIESNGRITTISSISGVLSSALFGPYSMSKHAMEAFGDSLAAEMQKFDVHVSLIEPGTYSSNIGASLAKRIEERDQSFEESQYKEEIAGALQWATETLANSGDPMEVAETVHDALFEENPKRRYMIVPNQDQAGWTINTAMAELVQLNQGQDYSYSREELIEILDQSLAANP